MHRFGLGRRPVGLRGRDGDLRDPIRRGERGREQGPPGARDVQGGAGTSRDHLHAVGVHREVGVDGRVVDLAREAREPAVGGGPADVDRAHSVLRQRKEVGDPPARQPPARRPEPEANRRRERSPHLNHRRPELVGGHRRRLDHDGRTGQAGQRVDDDLGGGGSVELPAGARANGDRAEFAKPNSRLARRGVDAAGESRQLVVERRPVHAHRRCDVRAEDAHLDPPEAAQRPEPASFALSRGDGVLPVHRDTQLTSSQLPAELARGEDVLHHGTGFDPEIVH